MRLLIILLLLVNIAKAQRTRFPNVLNLQTTVQDVRDIEPTVFSDMGAWHAYALPAKKEDYGAFMGPLLMDMNGRWLSNTFSKFSILEHAREIDLAGAKASCRYFPGLLEQELETEGLKILLQLIFVSNREALLQTKIINTSGRERVLTLRYSGRATGLSAGKNKITAGADKFVIRYLQDAEITADSVQYRASWHDIVLQKGQRFALTQVQAFYPDKIAEPATYQFAAELQKNEHRWNTYLERYFSPAPVLDRDKQMLAVKAIVTLLTNWRSPSKDILHDGVFPSVNYQGFYGVWSWDSWKQAVGLGYFNPELAKDNIRCMFDYQDEYGMIADCIYADKKENNWRDTKPPLAAWAVFSIYQTSRDVAFVKELLPKLLKYHQWWYRYRDHDKNGLCEYGSTDGTRIAAAWESGMDNAVRFDSAVMLKNSEHAWSLDQESVDLNAYLYAEKLYLSELCTLAGEHPSAATFKQEAAALGALVNQHFYKDFYYDKRIGGTVLIPGEGTEGWIPLWAGIATPAQAAMVKSRMEDEKKFNTKVPLPTFTADHPKFDPMKGYWRGPVWLDQFYFGTAGLRRYGYLTLAAFLEAKLFAHAEGLMKDQPIFENYHPLTGKGLNAKNFSWSAAHLLMILKNK